MSAPLCCHCGTDLTGKRSVLLDDMRACCESCAESPSPGRVEHGTPYPIKRAPRTPKQVDPTTGRRKPVDGVPFEADPTRYGIQPERRPELHAVKGDEGGGAG